MPAETSTDTTAPDTVPTMVEMTVEEFDAAIKAAEERGKNRSWAEARRNYKAKSIAPEIIEALQDRLAKVEKLLVLAFQQTNQRKP